MIGLASGSWAQVVVNLPHVKELTVVEINPGYVEIIRRHPEAAWLLVDPRRGSSSRAEPRPPSLPRAVVVHLGRWSDTNAPSASRT
jgi:hypothetical protein